MNKVTALANIDDSDQDYSIIEQVVMQGDLSKLSPKQRVIYYNRVCESIGLNPYTRPFDYISLNGKLTLYAKKDATEQLRQVKKISISELEGKIVDDLYIVKAKATMPDGRIDQSTAAVSIGALKGEHKANAIMKAETKAKRRVTLSIAGLGWTDESEVESIPSAQKVEVDLDSGELKNKISEEKANELQHIFDECDDVYKAWAKENMKKAYNITEIKDLPSNSYDSFKKSATAAMHKNHEKQREIFEASQKVQYAAEISALEG